MVYTIFPPLDTGKDAPNLSLYHYQLVAPGLVAVVSSRSHVLII